MVRRGTALVLLVAAIACGGENVQRAAPLSRIKSADATGSAPVLPTSVATLRLVDKTVSFSSNTSKAAAHPNKLSGRLNEPLAEDTQTEMPENAQTDQCGFPAIEGEQECGAAHVIFKCADQGQYWAYGIEQANGQCPFSIPAECFCGSYTAPRLASGHEEEIVVRFAARAELARLTVFVYGYGYTTDSMKLLGSGITNNPAPVLVNIDGLSPVSVAFPSINAAARQCASSDILTLAGEQLIDNTLRNVGQDGEFTLRIRLGELGQGFDGIVAYVTGVSVVRWY